MSLFSWFTGETAEELAARDAETERQNRALNERLYREGKLTDEQYRIVLRHDAADNLGTAADIETAVDDAFDEGWEQGADNIRGAVGDTVNTVVGTPLKLIPWQLWIAAGAYVAWRLGLFDGLLKGWLKKAR